MLFSCDETYVVNSSVCNCQSCGRDAVCMDACPVEAFIWKGQSAYIQYQYCVCCGACEPVCPVNAIVGP